MVNENILVGYFFECLSCKANFIRILPRDFAVTHEGRIYLKDAGQNSGIDRARAGADERIFVAVVRCPCCLSKYVRSAEIGDKK
jgi:hypothetical protein